MALGNNKKSIKNNNGVALDYFFLLKKHFFFVKLKNSSLSFYIEKEACNIVEMPHAWKKSQKFKVGS
jgi:hypothetical protein